MSPRPLDFTFTPAGASELFPSPAPLSPSAGEFVAAFTELAAIDPAAWCLSPRPQSALQTPTGTPNRLNMGRWDWEPGCTFLRAWARRPGPCRLAAAHPPVFMFLPVAVRMGIPFSLKRVR